MRRLMFALPLALLPLVAAQAHEQGHDHEHGSLGAHEHGVARLNAALDQQTLELELQSPAMNLVGFEHAATSDADKAKAAAVHKQLEQSQALFNLPAAAGCKLTDVDLDSPLFGDKPDADDHDHDDEDVDDHIQGEAHHHEHSEIHAQYSFTCSNPTALKQVDLSPTFKHFPATQKIQVQLISPSGQKGMDATPSNSQLAF